MTRAQADDPRAVIIALLSARREGATICPSEVARALASTRSESPEDWRNMMPAVHDEVDRMLAQGDIRLSWKGKPLKERVGPYRIHHGQGEVET